MRLFCILLAALLAGCAAPSPDLSSKTLQQSMQVLAEHHDVCAVTLAVIKNRKLATIDAASACQPRPLPGPDSVFQAASLSKPVFAYAVLKLVAQGKLALDTPLTAYLPTPGSGPQLQALTVRMVLNHTTGLPNWANGPLLVDGVPGTKWRYSGEAYVLLQRAVEAVTGQPLDQYMQAAVFKPLAMDRSSYVWNARIAQTLLPGTKANGAPRTTMVLQDPVSAYSLHTTAADYAKFLVALLNDEALIEQITASPVSVDPALGLAWGLGWGVADSHIWQWGNNPGYRAFVIASLRTGDALVMLTNGENGLKLAEPVTRKVLPGEHKLFQFSMLEDDIMNIVCNSLRFCL